MQIPQDLPVDAGHSLFAPGRRALSIGAVALCSMLAFEAIGVATAMPAIAQALDGLQHYALAFAGTTAVSLVGMVLAGLWCDRAGPRLPMAGGMLLFGAGLLASGAAADMAWMLAGRLLQGLGIGMLGVVLYVAIGRGVPAALHPRLFALFSAAWVVPCLIGPALTGLVVEHASWRWLFSGVAVLLLPTAWLVLPAVWGIAAPVPGARSKSPALRPLGWSVLAAVAVIGLNLGGVLAAPWTLPASVAAIGLAWWAALRLLPGGTLRIRPGLPSVIALRGLLSSAFFLSEAFIPLWLHQLHGWSIGSAGAALSCGALSWSAGSQLQSRLQQPAVRQRWLRRGCWIVCGSLVLTTLAAAGRLPVSTIWIAWTLTGLGVGLALPMLGVLSLQLSEAGQQGSTSSALQLSAALATSMALGLAGLAMVTLDGHSRAAVYAVIFAAGALLAGCAGWHALRTGQVPGALCAH